MIFNSPPKFVEKAIGLLQFKAYGSYGKLLLIIKKLISVMVQKGFR